MDISEKYIKMCEKAEEIQKEWKPQKADLYLACTLEARAWRYYGFNEMSWCMWKIWLPRQDQLQEMFQLDKNSHYTQMIDIIDNYYHVWIDYIWELQSMEQFMLSCLMKEKFNKIWDDKKEEWVKE